MPIISFWIIMLCILAATGIFSYALWLLAKHDAKASGTMNIGFGIGLIGIILSAIIYGFFYL
jgi:hypothetical protein